MAPPPPTSKPVTISDLLPLTQTSSHTYDITLLDAWCVGTVPNGGYITSAFLHAARTHMRQTHPDLPCSDPINLHLEFLRRTAVGPGTFVVRDVKLGSRISNLHLTLRQRRDPTGSNDDDNNNNPWQDEVEGYITLTSLSTESGPSHETHYRPYPPPVPADLSRLPTDTDPNYIRRRPDPYGAFRRATLHCDMYLVRPPRRPAPPLSSPAIADQWVRFRPVQPSLQTQADFAAHLKQNATNQQQQQQLDGLPLPASEGRWTNDALGYAVDIFPQLNERFVNSRVEDALLTPTSQVTDAQIQDMVKSSSGGGGGVGVRTYWYPTLLLNLDVKKSLPPEGVEWLFVRVQAKTIKNGRFDLCVEVWDEEGDLVALSTHASLVLDASRNVQRKDNKKESKM